MMDTLRRIEALSEAYPRDIPSKTLLYMVASLADATRNLVHNLVEPFLPLVQASTARESLHTVTKYVRQRPRGSDDKYGAKRLPVVRYAEEMALLLSRLPVALVGGAEPLWLRQGLADIRLAWHRLAHDDNLKRPSLGSAAVEMRARGTALRDRAMRRNYREDPDRDRLWSPLASGRSRSSAPKPSSARPSHTPSFAPEHSEWGESLAQKALDILQRDFALRQRRRELEAAAALASPGGLRRRVAGRGFLRSRSCRRCRRMRLSRRKYP